MTHERFAERTREYRPLSPRSIYENEFESYVVEATPALFPGLVAFRWDPLLASPLGTVRPDLALIDPSLTRWWMVEVELSHHPLGRHVLPQLEKMAHAELDDVAVRLLDARLKRLGINGGGQMAATLRPNVLCVADADPGDWRDAIEDIGGRLVIASPYRDQHGHTALRSSTNLRARDLKVIGKLSPLKGLNRALVITAQEKFFIPPTVPIETDGVITLWDFHEIGTLRCIFPRGDFEPAPGGTYVLLMDTKSRLFMRISQEGDQ